MSKQAGPYKTASEFPMVPKHLYDNFPKEVKAIMKQQHPFYLEKHGKTCHQDKNKARAVSNRSIKVPSREPPKHPNRQEQTCQWT